MRYRLHRRFVLRVALLGVVLWSWILALFLVDWRVAFVLTLAYVLSELLLARLGPP